MFDACPERAPPLRQRHKYKRCGLARSEGVAREFRDRDALLDDVVQWLRDEHQSTQEDDGEIEIARTVVRNTR